MSSTARTSSPFAPQKDVLSRSERRRSVRTAGFEPAVSCSRSTRNARLSHVLKRPHSKPRAPSGNRTRTSASARQQAAVTSWALVGKSIVGQPTCQRPSLYVVGTRGLEPHRPGEEPLTRQSQVLHQVGSPENRTQRTPVIGRGRATSPQLPSFGRPCAHRQAGSPRGDQACRSGRARARKKPGAGDTGLGSSVLGRGSQAECHWRSRLWDGRAGRPYAG